MDLKELHEQIRKCKGCPLHENATQKVIIRGCQKDKSRGIQPDLLIVAEAPGAEEDKTGKPMVGMSGKMLQEAIDEAGLDSYAITNMCLCRPPENRDPTLTEKLACSVWLQKHIDILKPKIIVPVGNHALGYFMPENSGITREAGRLTKISEDMSIFPIIHPSYYLRNRSKANELKVHLKKLKVLLSDDKPKIFVKELEYQASKEDAMKEFFETIRATSVTKDSFEYAGKKWLVDFHPLDHSDDVIVHEGKVNDYDNFLLVKTGGDRIRIPGWTDQKTLLSTPKRDIYRNGKSYHMVVDANLNSLESFEIENTNLVLLKDYIINKQVADDKGKYEMIDGILAGLHSFVNMANVMFRDVNQVDECYIGDKKVKIYTRTAEQDENMLIKDNYYKANSDVEYYVLCKAKGGKYSYLGFVDKSVVDKTRIVQMIGQDSSKASGDTRRIFAEQYQLMSEIIPVYVEKVEDKIEIVPQNFVPLHLHTEYSIGDGFGTISNIVDALYKKGFKGASITDHGTLGGAWDFQKKMLEKGLKPIIGYEAYVKIDNEEKPKERYHMVLHVKNEKGWENLKKLHTAAVREHFYYKPVIPLDMILENSEGLIATTACMQGVLNKLCSEKEYDKTKEILTKLKKAFGDDLYFEMMLHNIEDNQKTLQLLHALALLEDVKCIITLDSHYPNKEDKVYHDALKAISFRKKFGEAGYGDDCFYLMQDEDIEQKMLDEHMAWAKKHDLHRDWMANTFEILDKCDFQIQSGTETDTLPKMNFVGKTRAEALKELCVAGLAKNTPYKYEGKIKERLDLEIERILSKKYENYFLLVYKLIKWAKKSGIMCGPGRGSVGASLCAYALNITDCDPIKYNLLFDRFISDIRRDAPDIDMDFMDVRRGEIFKHLQEEYGVNNCAKVITFSRFHPKGAMRDIGRIFSIPIKEIEKINSLVIERSGGDVRSSFGLMDTFAEFDEAKKFKAKYPKETDIAIKIEGHIRHVGVHAAAMVVAENDISTYVPIRKIGGEICTEWDKQLCEDMKLVKLDVLALKTLSIVDDCIKSIEVDLPKKFDDVHVYKEIFHKGDTHGIFQFNNTGMSKFAQGLNITKFNDLYDATTLFRPGALHSGQAMLYANRKTGKEPVEYMHPLLEPLTKDTRGIILYQEQVMQVMNQIGGMSWAAAETVRKIITKSKGSAAFNKMREDFVRNTKKLHKMPEEESQRLFDVVSAFGSYSFNKAHAVEYSTISYWCIDGPTRLYDWDNKKYITISKAFKEGVDNIACYDEETKKTVSGKVKKIIRTTGAKNINKKMCYLMVTKSRKNLRCSLEHKILTPDGYKALSELSVGDLVAVEKRRSESARQDIRESISRGVKKHWKNIDEDTRKKRLKGCSNGGKKVAEMGLLKERWKTMSKDERIRRLKPFIEAGAKSDNGFHKRYVGKALDGHKVYSMNEKVLDDWLYNNDLAHKTQVFIDGKFADFLCKGVYIEFDGMNRDEKYFENKFKNEPYIVIRSVDSISDKLHFLLEEKHLRNGDEIIFEPIISIEKLGKRVMYDIIMESEPHNFLANGIVVHNCAWLKVYYPQHFYKSLLKFEGDDQKIQQYMQEAQRKGIVIEYPDVNKSIETYETVDGVIYAGILSIKGLGPKTAQKIIANKPYTSIDDFVKKTKLSTTGKVFKGLLVADAFRAWEPNKRAIYLELTEEEPDSENEWTEAEWAQLIYQHTSLKPKINIDKAFNFGDYNTVDICDLGEKHGGKQHFIRGVVTFIVNKDKLINDLYGEHIHKFAKRMMYVNVNDGTGDIAVVISPATFETFESLFQDLEGKPIVALGVLSKDGKKMYGDMIQIVDESCRTTDIDDIFSSIQGLKGSRVIVLSAQPCVSREKKSSYYRIILSDGTSGLYFRPEKKVFVGMKVTYEIDQVFLDLEFYDE